MRRFVSPTQLLRASPLANRRGRRLVSRAWTTLHWPPAIRLPGAPPLPNPLLPLPDDTERAPAPHFPRCLPHTNPVHTEKQAAAVLWFARELPSGQSALHRRLQADCRAQSFLSVTRSHPGCRSSSPSRLQAAHLLPRRDTELADVFLLRTVDTAVKRLPSNVRVDEPPPGKPSHLPLVPTRTLIRLIRP